MSVVSRLSYVATLSSLAALVACSSDTVTNPSAPPGLALSLSPIVDTIFVADTLGAGDVATLKLSATSVGHSINTPTGVEWSAADPTIVRVDSTGVLHPVGFGSTTVTARINDAKATATVVVAYKAVKVTLTPTSIAGLVGDTIQLTYSALDANGVRVPGIAYTLATADPTVATVTRTGLGTARLTFLKAGTARVTLVAAGQTVTATGAVQPRDFIGSVATSAPAGLLTMSAGDDATCGLLPLGRGYCFGRAGLIGIARDTACFNDLTGGTQPCTLIPLRIAGGLTLASISVGGSVACGTTTDNRAYCWGSQQYGQLGNGVATTGTSQVPSLVISPVTRNAMPLGRITAGGNHACGLTPGAAGLAYCWGQDSVFQLGNGDGFAVNSTTPIPIAGGALYTAISAGRAHTCALLANGFAQCWGDNSQGQLGNGFVGNSSDGPVTVAGPPFASISAGADHTCAITSTGFVYCWGGNASGQLGRGAPDAVLPSPAPIAAVGAFRAVSAGAASTCAVTNEGAALCWGANDYGQLGDGTRGGPHLTPGVVAGGRTDFVAIAVGKRHACAVAANGAWCWGSNMLGALGNELQAMVQLVPSKTAPPQ